MSVEEIVKQVSETIQKEANARAVFAEPMKLDKHLVIPVATVVVSIGGGGTGGSRRPAIDVARFFGAGGGGINVLAQPVGYIYEEGDKVVFAPIEKPHHEEKGLPERLMGVIASRGEKKQEKRPAPMKT